MQVLKTSIQQLPTWIRVMLIVTVTLCARGHADAQKPVLREHEVKAVFLFNFVQFVEWPPEAFPGNQTPLIIGILGKDPFGKFLDETVKGEVVNGHPLNIRRFQKPEDVKGCHILFVSMPRQDQQRDALVMLQAQHILTVSDTETFIKDGGMIRFITDANKIRFQVNLVATKEAGLTISSKLLRLAEIVTP